MKFNKHGKLAEVWEAAVAGMQLFVPHKAILSAAENILYVADRENRRVLSFGTVFGGNGHVFSDRTKLGGYPYAIDLNGSASDWPMYGVFGGVSQRALRGFTLDKDGGMTDTWGPQEVCDNWGGMWLIGNECGLIITCVWLLGWVVRSDCGLRGML